MINRDTITGKYRVESWIDNYGNGCARVSANNRAKYLYVVGLGNTEFGAIKRALKKAREGRWDNR